MSKRPERQPITPASSRSRAGPYVPSDLFAPDTPWSQLQCGTRTPQLLHDHRRRFEAFAAWCEAHVVPVLPAAPETVGAYLLALAPTHRLNTLRNIASAIAFVHRLNGLPSPSPSLRPVWRTIVRQHGGRARSPHGLVLDELAALLAALTNTRRGARDRALLLMAFWGGLTAAELVGLNLREPTPGTIGLVQVDHEGVALRMRSPGTALSPSADTVRRLGRQPELCPVAALEHWLAVGGIADGPIFRRIRRGDHVGTERLTSPNVSRLVRRIWGEAFGEARVTGDRFCFRSLRTGFVVSAIEAGISEERIALHLGWRTTAALETYRSRQSIRRDRPVVAVMAALSDD